VEITAYKVDQTMQLLVHVKRDAIYAQKRGVSQIDILRKRGIERTIISRGCRRRL
jgi:hypothetical protein